MKTLCNKMVLNIMYIIQFQGKCTILKLHLTYFVCNNPAVLTPSFIHICGRKLCE
jgi:hypothetical protein